MLRTQISLTEEERRALDAESARTRRSISALIRDAVDAVDGSERPLEGALEAMRGASTLAWHDVDAVLAEQAGVLGRQWLPSHHGIDGADLARRDRHGDRRGTAHLECASFCDVPRTAPALLMSSQCRGEESRPG